MSKSALSKSVREATGCTVAQADAAVEAMLSTIVDGVKTPTPWWWVWWE